MRDNAEPEVRSVCRTRRNGRTIWLRLATAFWLSVTGPGGVYGQEQYGRFVGAVITEWAGDREMKVTREFSYEDPRQKVWMVPAGTIVDGASIPRALWSVLGAPFVGQYRRAAVVHDYYCDTREEDWREVHRMFYYASRAGGVSAVVAKLLYGGGYLFGPRWEKRPPGMAGALPSVRMNEYVEKDWIELRKMIEEQNPSLEEIVNTIERIEEERNYCLVWIWPARAA